MLETTVTPLPIMKLNQRDSVVVALSPIPKATQLVVDQQIVTTLEDIPQGHKIALVDLKEGENVIKYGYPIGHVTTDVKAGEWLHTHNVKTNLSGELTYHFQQDVHPISYPFENRTFQGYVRKNGKVGIRNDLFIVPTVGCVNGVAELIVKEFKQKHPDLGNFDHVTILKHPYGCSQLGKDHLQTRDILADAVHHPNAGGVLVFGLGCENNTVPEFKKTLGEYDDDRVKFLVAQEVYNEIEQGVALLE